MYKMRLTNIQNMASHAKRSIRSGDGYIGRTVRVYRGTWRGRWRIHGKRDREDLRLGPF